MLGRGLSKIRPAAVTALVGTAAGGFVGGMAYQQQRQPSPENALHQQNILKALKIIPEEVRASLEAEEKSYDKAQKELKVMKLLLTKEQIAQGIEQMSDKIAEKFKGEKHLLVLTMLHGANYVSTDLKRQLYNKHQLLFKEEAIRITRYGDNVHGGLPKIERMPAADKIAGRKILIIEDLIEEGVTLQWTIAELMKLGAKREDIYIAAFTDKVNARKKDCEHIRPDFSSYQMTDNQWVVGNGCDQAGYARPADDLMYFPKEEQQKFGYTKK